MTLEICNTGLSSDGMLNELIFQSLDKILGAFKSRLGGVQSGIDLMLVGGDLEIGPRKGRQRHGQRRENQDEDHRQQQGGSSVSDMNWFCRAHTFPLRASPHHFAPSHLFIHFKYTKRWMKFKKEAILG